MSSGSPRLADGCSNDAAMPTIGRVTGNGFDGSEVLNDTCTTETELMMLWMVSSS